MQDTNGGCGFFELQTKISSLEAAKGVHFANTSTPKYWRSEKERRRAIELTHGILPKREDQERSHWNLIENWNAFPGMQYLRVTKDSTEAKLQDIIRILEAKKTELNEGEKKLEEWMSHALNPTNA
jgi:hypothetical protein